MSNWNFRLAQVDDTAFITQRTLELTEYEQSLAPDIGLKLNKNIQQHIKDWIATMISAESATIIVAEHKKKLAGFIIGLLETPSNPFTAHQISGRIQLLWIDKSLRNQKIGSALVEAIETHFIELGAEYIDLDHAYGNTIAKTFWSKRGYLPASIGRRKLN